MRYGAAYCVPGIGDFLAQAPFGAHAPGRSGLTWLPWPTANGCPAAPRAVHGRKI